MRRTGVKAALIALVCAAASAPVAANGEPPHVVELASDSQTTVTAAAFADDGTLVVGGTFFGKLVVGKTRLAARRADWQDGFVARIDRAGKVTWLASATGDDVSAIAIGPDGAIAVAGSTSSIVGKADGPATHYRYGATLALLAADGKLRWKRDFASSDRSWTNGVTFAGDAIVACGAFAGTATFNTTEVQSTIGWPGKVPTDDVFVARMTPDGKLDWFATGGGDEDDRATACATLPSGDIAVVGTVGARATFGTVHLVGPDEAAHKRLANPLRGFVAIYAPNGASLSALELGQRDSARIEGVATLADGTLIVRGGDEDVQTGAPHPFIARVVAGNVTVRDADAPTAAIVGGELVSVRPTPGALVVEQQFAARTVTLATIAVPVKPKLELTALAASNDGRLALVGRRGDEVEHPLGGGRIEVDLSHEHGFVALVSKPEDFSALRSR
ncbi:MAG TPA: hypothetical protein VMJ10_30695 [Kofleriaceae bacterium]|nr:hypothetical protein [Kofleriaceae bacterium]